MENIVIAVLLILMIGFAARRVLRARSHGSRCTGCPGGGCRAGGIDSRRAGMNERVPKINPGLLDRRRDF